MKAVRAFATGCAVFLAACNGTGGPPIFAAPQQDVARQVDGQLFYSIEGPNLGNKDSHGRLVSASLGVSAFPAPAAHVPIELLDASLEESNETLDVAFDDGGSGVEPTLFGHDHGDELTASADEIGHVALSG